MIFRGVNRVTLIVGLPPRLTSFWNISSQILHFPPRPTGRLEQLKSHQKCQHHKCMNNRFFKILFLYKQQPVSWLITPGHIYSYTIQITFCISLNSISPQLVWDGGVPNGGNFLTNLPNWERESQEKVEQPIQKESIFNVHHACLSSVILINLKSVKSQIHSEITI